MLNWRRRAAPQRTLGTFRCHQNATCHMCPLLPSHSSPQHGGYGSIGYGYAWATAEAEKNLLRTHTTAVSSRMLYQLAQVRGDRDLDVWVYLPGGCYHFCKSTVLSARCTAAGSLSLHFAQAAAGLVFRPPTALPPVDSTIAGGLPPRQVLLH